MSKLLNLRRQEEGDKKRASDAEASSGDDEEAFKRRSTVKYGGEVSWENRELYYSVKHDYKCDSEMG